MTQTVIPPGMGRCEVTGKIVPDDELVTLQGQRVCAEGKAILLERLKAGEVMPGEAERPTVLRRFACILVDNMLLWVPTAVISVAFGMMGMMAGRAGVVVQGIGQLLLVVIVVAYFTLMHGTRAQTLGKMAGKLKVVRLDGQPMDMKTGFIRAMAYRGVALVTAFAMMIGMPLLMIVTALIVWGYLIADAIVALADRSEQRALHDRIAGTRVVMLNS